MPSLRSRETRTYALHVTSHGGFDRTPRTPPGYGPVMMTKWPEIELYKVVLQFLAPHDCHMYVHVYVHVCTVHIGGIIITILSRLLNSEVFHQYMTESNHVVPKTECTTLYSLLAIISRV